MRAQKELCQSLCIDDLCRASSTLCGQTFCEACGNPCIFDESVCDDCRERYEDEELDELAAPPVTGEQP
jgi:hypothetical protein